VIIGPLFTRELATAPRRPRLYLVRAAYPGMLVVLMLTAWLVLTGTQLVRDVGDLARFGSLVFQLLAPLQWALVGFIAALSAAGAVAHEKDRRTFVLLLLTHLTNSELVLGKLLASLLSVGVMLAASLPVFLLITLFGGVSFEQIGRVYLVTAATALVCGSLGSTIALWREKTFQALAVTLLALVVWVAVGELAAGGAIAALGLGPAVEQYAALLSPWRALSAAMQPFPAAMGACGAEIGGAWGADPTLGFLLFALATAAVLNATAMIFVRHWHVVRDEQGARAAVRSDDAGAGTADEAAEQSAAPSSARPAAEATAKTRPVWDNPVLWREVRTWAYGRKVLAVRLGYLGLCLLAAAGLQLMIEGGRLAEYGYGAAVLVPLVLLSLVLVNAQAVSSLTAERDAKSLDLLLVTDLTPAEIVFGKLGGVFYNVKEMIAVPLLLLLYLWWRGGIGTENLIYLIGGGAVLYLFVAVVGLHMGMIYENTRIAAATSLGAVFFLFLGVAACMRIMVAFSGSFHAQLLPFAALGVFGGLGLYLALGARNPSTALAVAAFACPLATFYALTSYLLGATLGVFLVTTAAYGFATAAMLVPAVYEFDTATGRGD